MADRMIEDLIVLAKMNKLLEHGAGEAGVRSRSGRPYRVIRFVFGGPETHGTLGAKAEEVLDEVLAGVGLLGHLDLAVLSGLLGVWVSKPRRPDQLPLLRAGVHAGRARAWPAGRRGAPAAPAAVE
jgi:hypothetical protein